MICRNGLAVGLGSYFQVPSRARIISWSGGGGGGGFQVSTMSNLNPSYIELELWLGFDNI